MRRGAVVAVDGGSCRRRCDFARAPASAGLLASVVTMETGCGGPDCPWLVRVDAGQTVNITLINFARSHDQDDDDGDDDDEPNVTNDATRDCKVHHDDCVVDFLLYTMRQTKLSSLIFNEYCHRR